MGNSLVKPTSKRPKTSTSVQTSPDVQNRVVSRIIGLRNLGLGFRRISKRLEDEGLATMSKSTVANYCSQAQAQSEISARKLRKDPELRALGKAEAKLQKQVNQIEMHAQARRRVRDLQLQRAETHEGRQDIFKNIEELKEFIQQTLYDSEALKAFERHCEVNKLPLVKTLSDAIGPLEEYEAENQDLFWPDLSSYIEEKLDNFVLKEEQTKRNEQLQKVFSERELNRRCPDCNATIDNMFIDVSTSENVCSCRRRFKSFCVACGNALFYDNNKEFWVCRKCGAIYERPSLKLDDFIFTREPL